MFCVDQVELAPFRCGERTEHGVIGQWLASTESGFAFLNDSIHTSNVFQNLFRHLLRRSAARHHPLRGFASARKVSASNQDQSLPTHAAAVGAGAGSAGIKAALQAFDCPQVAQVQVLEDFGGTPLPFRMAGELVGVHAADGA